MKKPSHRHNDIKHAVICQQWVPDMPDQIIDAIIAYGLHTDARRMHNLVDWIVMHDPPENPDKVIARLVSSAPTLYLLLADNLVEIHAALLPALVHSDRQLWDPPEVLEI